MTWSMDIGYRVPESILYNEENFLKVHILRISEQRIGGSSVPNNLIHYMPELNRLAPASFYFLRQT